MKFDKFRCFVKISNKMKKYLAEMVGTMVLVLMGCGSAVFAGNAAGAVSAGVGTIGVALAFGLSVVAMAYTFIFVLVVLGSTDSKKGAGNFAGLAIGLTLVLIHIVCIPITGTSVNPARSIGPAIFEGGRALSQLWLFIVAPLAGGAAAALAWKCIGSERN